MSYFNFNKALAFYKNVNNLITSWLKIMETVIWITHVMTIFIKLILILIYLFIIKPKLTNKKHTHILTLYKNVNNLLTLQLQLCKVMWKAI